MRHTKKANEIIKRIKDKIHNLDFMILNRNSDKDFTRKRKLPFVSLILFMLNLLKQTLQKEITHFVTLLSLSGNSPENISKSAFSQSRLKLKPGAFIDLNEVLINEFYTDNDEKRLNHFRILATDGSTLQLPPSKEIIDYFGCVKNNSEMTLPSARISNLYDVLNELIIDSQIAPYNTGEYELAKKHLSKTDENDLIIYDRGYGAYWFFYKLLSEKRNFVIRLQKRFILESDSFWQSKEMSKIVEITKCSSNLKKQFEKQELDFKPFKIRFVKVVLDTGEIELLATSLLDENKYLTSIFKDIYFMRWGIEVNFDHLKNNLQLENFSGLSVISTKQDFYANVFINNLQTVIIRDAQKELKQDKKDTQYEYKINRRLSLGFMKDRLIKILMSNKLEYMEELKKLFKIEPVPIRKNRKNLREFHKSKRKYHLNNRRAV